MNYRFSRIALIGKLEDAQVADSMAAFARHLLKRGMEVIVDEGTGWAGLPAGVEHVAQQRIAAEAELIVAIGGDGTMLHAAQLAIGNAVPLLGINRGRLGFLTDVLPEEMFNSFDAVLAGRYETDERALMVAQLVGPDGAAVTCHALNDVVVQKHETGRLIELETWIDGCFVNTHGGDGLVIASSTGSTAYALSCGGPILHPRLDAIVLAPISPHTLSDRPIVISRHDSIEVRLPAGSASRAQVTCDGKLVGEFGSDSLLAIGPAASGVTLLHPPGHDFYRILRSKLHWGRSGRSRPEQR